MSSNILHDTEQKDAKEFEILNDIREAEKKAEDIIERAKAEKDSILHEAAVSSSKLLASGENDIKKAQDKKIADFRDKSKFIKEEKVAEGKNMAAHRVNLNDLQFQAGA